jgi:hypothetical protein
LKVVRSCASEAARLPKGLNERTLSDSAESLAGAKQKQRG